MRSEAVEAAVAELVEQVGLAAVALAQAEAARAAGVAVAEWQPRSWPAQLKLRSLKSVEADVEARAD